MGAALGLAAYLVFAPGFVLPALTLLLIAAGPSTAREWWWILAGGLWLVLSGVRQAGLVDLTVLAGGVLVSGAFFAAMINRPRPLFSAALVALAVGGAGLIFWGLWLGVGLRDLELAFIHDCWRALRLLLTPELGDSAVSATPAVQAYADQVAPTVGPLATLLPAIMALSALGGTALAWNWYHRISLRPLGPPLGRLAEFRFNDQLVWGVVFGLGALVLPAPALVHELGANLMVFFGGLFAVRGLAVTRTWLQQAPGPLLGFMALSLLFIAPVAMGGLLSLGLADTWLDFRRRTASPTVEG